MEHICQSNSVLSILFHCISQGVTLLMMGSADALPSVPKEKVAFVEDMTESELATAVSLIRYHF